MSKLTAKRQEALAQWLFEHGGPVIRYHLADEFDFLPGNADIESLRADLLRDATVRKWLNNLKSYEFMAEHIARIKEIKKINGLE